MEADDVALAEEQVVARPHRRWLPPRVVTVALVVLIVLAGGSAVVLARFGRPLAAAPLVLVAQRDGAEPQELARRAARAARQLEAARPQGLYLVVDTFRNRLHVIKDGQPERTAVCSTGTGNIVRDPRTGKQWVFDTPLGERVVERKVKNPVWAKPDWAFIEEGYLPPTDPNERFDDVSLGDYALYMGDGYIIHGTLFKSLLGRRVTHGCIRLGDEDLEFVYRNARIGTRVYLY